VDQTDRLLHERHNNKGEIMYAYQRLALLVFTLLILAIACTTVSAQEIEQIKNGGFENGLEGWTPDPKHELVEGEQSAHSDEACVSGETLGPNQALRLSQDIEVSAGNLYKFSCWARGTNQTKLVLFGTFPGETQRRSITVWDRLPNRWTPCTTLINVPADGVLKLELISPSSYGTNPGKIWIDDVSLLETVMPEIEEISDDATYDDDPCAATADDGSVYIAWIAFHDGADALEIARVRPLFEKEYIIGTTMTFESTVHPSRGINSLGQWTLPHDHDTAILTPTLIPQGDGVLLIYSTEIDGQWEICSVSCDENGPGEVNRLTENAITMIHPSAAFDKNGVLWIAYEMNYCYRRRIGLVAINPEGEEIHRTCLTSSLLSAYDPSLVVLDSGEVVVAYYGFRDDNYDVYIRQLAPGAEKLADERRLTFAPSIDRHARLATNGDDLYIVWESTNCREYRIGSCTERSLILAKIEEDGLLVPGVESPLSRNSEKQSIQFDGHGQLWIAYRRTRGRHQAWGSWLTTFDTNTGTFLASRPVTLKKGMNTSPGLALYESSYAFVASQWDDTPNQEQTREDAMDAISNIDVALAWLTNSPQLMLGSRPTRVRMIPLVESDAPFEPAAIRREHNEDLDAPSIRYEDTEYELYFGDLHEHTEISICNREGDQTLEESYAHMRDIARYDFACITDHGYNMNPYRWHQAAKWARAEYDGSLDRPNARFLTLLGFEWTSTHENYTHDHPHGYYGHRNLILSDMHFPRWWNAKEEFTPMEMWAELREMEADFVHIPHQLADTGNVPFDHNFHDEEAQPVAEIFQTRGSYEYFGAPRMAGRTTGEPGAFMQDVWADGLVIGVIASPDHGGGYGKACVYAENLSREAILDALRARRCYGSTGAKIILDVRVNERMMGEKIADSPNGPVTVDINVSTPQPIKEIVVWRSNVNMFTHTPDGSPNELTLQYVDDNPLAGESYYYVRVILENDEIAWTSPVWFGKE
jgi:hypothetical protein